MRDGAERPTRFGIWGVFHWSTLLRLTLYIVSGAEFGHLGSVSSLNITQTHFLHRVGAEFGHLGSVSLLNITQTHFVYRGRDINGQTQSYNNLHFSHLAGYYVLGSRIAVVVHVRVYGQT